MGRGAEGGMADLSEDAARTDSIMFSCWLHHVGRSGGTVMARGVGGRGWAILAKRRRGKQYHVVMLFASSWFVPGRDSDKMITHRHRSNNLDIPPSPP